MGLRKSCSWGNATYLPFRGKGKDASNNLSFLSHPDLQRQAGPALCWGHSLQELGGLQGRRAAEAGWGAAKIPRHGPVSLQGTGSGGRNLAVHLPGISLTLCPTVGDGMGWEWELSGSRRGSLQTVGSHLQPLPRGRLQRKPSEAGGEG